MEDSKFVERDEVDVEEMMEHIKKDVSDLQKEVHHIFGNYPVTKEHKHFHEFHDEGLRQISNLTQQLVKSGLSRKGALIPHEDDIKADRDCLGAVLKFCKLAIIEKKLNPSLVKWALGIFLAHSKEAQRLGVIPPSIKHHVEYKNTKGIPLSNPVTAESLSGVGALTYFREDYDLNDHHYHWHLVYPSSGPPQPDGLPPKRTIKRQGEMFLYMHSQMVARYNAELLSWGLDMLHAWGYDDVLTLGYIPVPLNREIYGSRPPFHGWYENYNPIYTDPKDIPPSKKTLIDWRNNLIRSIDDGYFSTKKKNGEAGRLKLTEDNAMNWVGVVLEAEIEELQEVEPESGEYINRELYGSLHNNGHNKFAEIGATETYPINVMGSSKVAPCDHCFWLWHRHVDDFRHGIVKKYVHRLDEYQPKVKLLKVAIVPRDPKSKTPTGGISTYLGPPKFDKGEANAKVNHEPYQWELSVESTRIPSPDMKNPQVFTFRIFIAPKALIQDQRSWIEMDKFTHILTKLSDDIVREDTVSSVARKTPKEGETLSARCSCGWPQNMMLPIGTEEGTKYIAFVILTDDMIQESGTQAVSFCGTKDGKYPDPRGMGYPFDKTWARRVDSTAPVSEIVEEMPHVKTSEFTIYRYIKVYEGDSSKPKRQGDTTWDNTIKDFFTPTDVKCMIENGPFDLSNQKSVEMHAKAIHAAVSSGDMPQGDTRWSKKKCATFETWMGNGCP